MLLKYLKKFCRLSGKCHGQILGTVELVPVPCRGKIMELFLNCENVHISLTPFYLKLSVETGFNPAATKFLFFSSSMVYTCLPHFKISWQKISVELFGAA